MTYKYLWDINHPDETTLSSLLRVRSTLAPPPPPFVSLYCGVHWLQNLYLYTHLVGLSSRFFFNCMFISCFLLIVDFMLIFPRFKAVSSNVRFFSPWHFLFVWHFDEWSIFQNSNIIFHFRNFWQYEWYGLARHWANSLIICAYFCVFFLTDVRSQQLLKFSLTWFKSMARLFLAKIRKSAYHIPWIFCFFL